MNRIRGATLMYVGIVRRNHFCNMCRKPLGTGTRRINCGMNVCMVCGYKIAKSRLKETEKFIKMLEKDYMKEIIKQRLE